jgi:glutamate/tyrosine decarboxylase-like PLP-dependent enzyme
MQYLGEEGYLRLTRQTLDATDRLLAGVRALDGVHVWGEPDMTVVALGSRTHDIFAVGDALNARGWHFDRQEGPPSLHLMTSPRHKLVVDEFLADLRASLERHAAASTKAATYGDDVSAEASAMYGEDASPKASAT